MESGMEERKTKAESDFGDPKKILGSDAGRQHHRSAMDVEF